MRSLLATAVFLLACLAAAGPASAQDPEQPEPSLAELDGEWRASYVDALLGVVSGVARIDAAAGSAEVAYRDPVTGSSFSLRSTALRLDGTRLTIELEGRSPHATIEDGRDAPGVVRVLDPSARAVTLRWGQDRAALELLPLPETDRDRVTLELVVGKDSMGGSWSYRTHQFIGRAADGRGRDGETRKDPTGAAWTTGHESWARPRSVVFGVIPLEDQLELKAYSDGSTTPLHGYPFGKQPTPLGQFRTLFVFGKDLPSDYSRSLRATAVGPGVDYEILARRSDAANSATYAAWFAEGWQALRERLAPGTDALAAFEELDAVLVRARLNSAVIPGTQTFELNGQEVGWLLQFGDNIARARIVRQVGREKSIYEPTGYLFPGEFVKVEIETAHPLPVDVLNVMVGIDGQPLLLGDGKGIPAGRDPENRYLYRTDYIYLHPKLAAGSAVDYRAEQGFYAVPVRQGSALTALLGDTGTISVPPAMAQATVFETAGDTGVGGNWESWLAISAACAGVTPDADAAEADTISEYLISEIFNPEFKLPIWLETKVSVGQHAAMLLLRDTLVRLLERNRAQFARLETDEEMLAFRRHFEATVRQGATPLAKIPVTSIDGVGQVEFIWTFEQSILAKLHDRQIDEIEKWAISATREALQAYVAAIAASTESATEIDDCDVEDLLKLTGSGFGPVADVARSKLMGQRDGWWFPNHRARAWVSSVDLLGQQLEIQEKVGAKDTEMVVMSVGIATIPVAIFGSAYGYMGAIIATFVIDVFDVAFGTYNALDEKWAQDKEVQFALGAADVLGMQRLEEAEAARQSWSQVFVNLGFVVGPAVVGGIFDAPDLFKAFESVLELRRAARGRIAVMVMNNVAPAAAGTGRSPAVAVVIETVIRGAAAAAPDAAADAAKQKLAGLVAGAPEVARRVDASAQPQIDAEAAPLGIKFDDLADAPEGVADDVIAYLGNIRRNAAKSQLDAGALKSADELDEFGGPDLGPAWEKNFSSEKIADLLRHYQHRADIRKILETVPERLARQLDNADPRHARIAQQVLESEPGLSMDAFEARVAVLLKRRDEPVSKAFYEQAAETYAPVEKALRKAGWRAVQGFKETGRYKRLLALTITDPDGRVGDLARSYLPKEKSFSFLHAHRDMRIRGSDVPNEPIRSMIPTGPEIPLDAARGTPTLQFYTMRIMNWLGIPYGSVDGIRRADMSAISNPRTLAQLHWFKTTYYVGTPWKDIPPDIISRFLLATHSGRYGAEALAFAGYRIKSARVLFAEGAQPAQIQGYRSDFVADPSGESFDDFLIRHGLARETEVAKAFTIEFDVEPWSN